MTRFLPLLLLLLVCACKQPIDNPDATWSSLVMDSTVVMDSTTISMIEPYRELIEDEMNRVLVTSDTIIYKVSPESPLGNLIADLSFDRAKSERLNNNLPVPDFCLLNFGGLRVDLPAGELSVRKAFELMPFENTLEVVELTPDSLNSLLNYIARVGGQPVSKIKMVVTDKVVSSATINQTTIDPKRNYLVVTTDYLANGGDRMTFFQNPMSRQELGLKLRDAIIDHFEMIGRNGQTLNPKIDGRLTVKK